MVFVNNAYDTYTELSIEDLNGSVIYYKEGRIDEKIVPGQLLKLPLKQQTYIF